MCGAALAAILSDGSNRWQLGAFVTIGVFSVLSDLTGVFVVRRVTISGSFLGIILASVILGGGPAAVLGVMTIVLRLAPLAREPFDLLQQPRQLRLVPARRGTDLRCADGLPHTSESAPLSFYLLVFVAFVLGLLVQLRRCRRVGVLR